MCGTVQPNRFCRRLVALRTISEGAQALLNAIQELEIWCGLKVNRKKTFAIFIARLGAGQQKSCEKLVYMGQAVTFLAPSVSVSMKAWVHKECDIMDEDALIRLQGAWENPEQKDECMVRMND